MLEGCKITSQQTVFAVLQERILFLLSIANVMCIENHYYVKLLYPTNILMVFRSSWRFCWVHAESPGTAYGGAAGAGYHTRFHLHSSGVRLSIKAENH